MKSGELYVKEGNLFADWVWQAAGVKDFSLAGDRIGVVLTDGRVQVKEGNLWSGWDSVASGGQSVELDGDRVGVLHTNGTVNVKEGPLNAGWATQSAGVKDLSLAGDRIGVVLTDGRVQVKEGNLWSGWDSVASGGQSVELDGDRVGVLHTNGTVNVKEGPLNAGWATQSAGVKDLSLAGDRIGVVLTDGRVQVKEGNLWSGWDSVASGGQSVELDGDRVGVLHTNGTVNVKEGPLNAGWATQAAGVTDLEIAAASAAPATPVSMQDLQNIWGAIPNAAVVAEGLPSLNQQMAIGGITSPARKAAFLSTLRHESGWRYNAVEAGSTSTYRGRGYVQLTGDFNYGPAGTYFGQNFLANPDAAASLAWSASIARWYWTVSRSGSNAAADSYDMGLISRYIGYRASTTEDLERCDDFKRALRYFNGGSLPVSEQSIVCLRH
ncbi:hypothetical protein OG992_32045 [Micromonospora sp. NBC_00362]|uniref:glycoside hydrolase family 19 protein n=1 Tax=Micromonospora sp. NBC_00362 TaxID=2975975 RepID=UPI00224C8CFA|nr:glycoside hydrolase family 19 protein [Micromonospora sp. NBC_00362]MCX5121797.1 hypothetical protein [Micromonospora sp. NBC_00362]